MVHHKLAISPRAILKSTAFRVLICTAIVWLLIFFYCKHTLWRDPHSAFFDDSAVYELQYSRQRQLEATDFLAKAEAHPGQHQPSLNPVICAGIATVKRDETQYLNGTLGSMLVGLTTEERSALNVRLLFASAEPSAHPNWDNQWLNVLDHWSGYNVSEQELDDLRKLEEEKMYGQKGVSDYIYLLHECFEQTTAPYIAIFEDDIIFAEGWLPKTLEALAELRHISKEWLYLRLFYTETFMFWDAKKDFWYGHMVLANGLAMSLAAVALLAVRTFSKLTRPYLDNLTLLAVVCITVPAFMTLTFMIGKYNLTPLRGVERMDDGCCTQALIFPSSQIVDVIDFLVERKAGQTDLIIEDYANAMSLERYALAPQQVQHVGSVSSRGASKVNTKSTWAFWFETYDAVKLSKEHHRMSESGIWRASSDGMAP